MHQKITNPLNSTALTTFALMLMVGMSQPHAAEALVEGDTYGPTDQVNGYYHDFEYGDDDPEDETVNVTFTASEGEYFSIGANGTDSLESRGEARIDVTLTNGGGAIGTSGIIFEDDITVDDDGHIALNIDNGHVTFHGNVSDDVDIEIGNLATPTTSQVDFVIVNDESLTIDADIDAVSEANTININVSNQSTNASNRITFNNAISYTLIDALTISDAGATNINNVEFESHINANTIYIGESGGDVQTHNITLSGNDATIAGDVIAVDGDTVNIVANGSYKNFNGDVSNIDLISMESGRVTFRGQLTNSSLQIDGANAEFRFEDDTTYDSDIALTENASNSAIRLYADIDYSGDITAVDGSSVTLEMRSGSGFLGTVTLANGNDRLESESGYNTITGDIDFGAGTDTFSIGDDTATLTSALTNLENVEIINSAWLIVNDGGSFTGDVTGDISASLAYGYDTNGGTFNLNGEVDTVNLSVNSGTLNTNGYVVGDTEAIRSISISNGTFNAQDDVTVNNSIFIYESGTLRIGAGDTVTAASFSSDSGTLIFDIASPSSAGYLNVTSGVVDLENITLEANVTGDDSLFTDGNQIKVAAGTGALIGTDGETGQESTTVEENSALFAIYAMDGSQLTSPLSENDLYYVFSREATIEETATSSNNKSTGAVFDALSGTEDTELSQIITRLNAASQEELDEILDSTTPDVASAVAAGSQNFVNNTLDITNEKINIARYGGNGLSAGDGTRESRSWGQLFGQATRQGYREGIAGYDANTYGLALGYDVKGVVDNAMFGVAVSYGVTDVDSDNATHSSTDINSYQLTAYGSYDLPKSVFLKSMLAYAYNDVETTRYNVGGLGNNAEGSYDADIYTVRVDTGRDYRYEGVRITPSVMAHYSHYNADSYQETGAGGAGLNVDTDSLDILEIGATVEAGWDFNLSNGAQLSPEVRVGYRYDVIGDKVETNSYFVGGGSSFQTQGADPAQGTLSLGGGIIYELNDAWDVSADYQYEYKSEYHSNSGLLRASYKF